ncbi:MAG: hypothetical protein KR126chlam4_00101 [Candidatus Anoxychlamydiales bacterium]|uniref:Uncharacterized protein n=1 Tax=marine sediment metagenome TaxID=412755 RepID=A0A0F9AN28_9ZZZZ|nr:hypothetical protein [Candidatus Anoxychlamydiales bacterium]NGX40284.1 hypothetical protein [Candidatus Anoxychlamydiales bacterium]
MLYRVNDFSPSHREYPIVFRMKDCYQKMGYEVTDNTFVDLEYDNSFPYSHTFMMKIVSVGVNKRINQISLTIFQNNDSLSIGQQAG